MWEIMSLAQWIILESRFFLHKGQVFKRFLSKIFTENVLFVSLGRIFKFNFFNGYWWKMDWDIVSNFQKNVHCTKRGSSVAKPIILSFSFFWDYISIACHKNKNNISYIFDQLIAFHYQAIFQSWRLIRVRHWCHLKDTLWSHGSYNWVIKIKVNLVGSRIHKVHDNLTNFYSIRSLPYYLRLKRFSVQRWCIVNSF